MITNTTIYKTLNENLDHNCSVDNNILESVGVPADSTAQSELLPSGGVLDMQGTLINIQRYSLTQNKKNENRMSQICIARELLPWEPQGTEGAPVWEC